MSLLNLIPAPYRIAALVAVALVACVACFVAGKAWSNNSWTAKYTERENELLKDLEKAKDKIREKEREAAENLAAIDAAYHKGLTDAQAHTDRTIADLRAGNLRLRRDLAASACADSDAASAAGGGDAGAGAQLWRSTTEALIRLADEADGVVRQLGACQAVVREYRNLCNGAQ